ncbi:NAD-dependent epimerase/dehydratase family protein [Sphingomonas sp. ERG5]|uniref:NAD-dependent epimerase/dehydratase family protein n=1 Tax=Sphingomonas sp. ERG5 TaxID=1381597 RepID=UPI000A84A96C|nr:NAD-dependent epimerase/dehydratase family protein [Sphingomonas sp. ERG5]
MYIILGGTGHVGSAAAKALLARGEAVTIVTHDKDKGAALNRPRGEQDWRSAR